MNSEAARGLVWRIPLEPYVSTEALRELLSEESVIYLVGIIRTNSEIRVKNDKFVGSLGPVAGDAFSRIYTMVHQLNK